MKSLPESIKCDLKDFWTFSRHVYIKYSRIPMDQRHKQNNELVKGSGGAVDLLKTQ